MTLVRDFAIATLALTIGTYASAAVNRRAGFALGRESGLEEGRRQGRQETLREQEAEHTIAYLHGKFLGLVHRDAPEPPINFFNAC